MNNLKVNYYFDKEIILIKNKYHRDNRGSFSELYNYNNFKKIGIKIKFVQDNISFSKKNILYVVCTYKPHQCLNIS